MKVVIIGAGLSGLTFGALASKDGHEVTIIDKNKKPGGVVALCEHEDFSFEQGPLILTDFLPGESMYNFLDSLGINLPMVRADRGLAVPDFELWHPEEYEGEDWRKKKLKELFPEDAAGIDEYYRFYNAMMKIRYLSSQKQNFFTKAAMMSTFMKVRKYEKMSAQEFTDTLFKNPKLGIIFNGIFADFCADPSEVSCLTIPFVNLEPAFEKRIPQKKHGKLYNAGFACFEGGCQKLPEALADFITENGGKILYETVAEKVLIEDGHVTGVKLSDGTVLSAEIVTGCGAARDFFYDMVGVEYLDEDYMKVLREFQPMEAVFMLHLGVDYDPMQYQKEPLCYYYGTYDLHGATERLRKGIYHEGNDGFLIYVPSAHAPEMAPEGCHAVTIYTVAPDRLLETDEEGKEYEVSWERKKEEYAEKLLLLAEKKLPDLRKHIVTMKIMTAEDYRELTHMTKSSFGGIVPVMNQKNPPHVTPVGGLYFLGAQSENGGGVGAVMQGAIDTYKKNM